jgi:dimethylhistidine N-methyltransferase
MLVEQSPAIHQSPAIQSATLQFAADVRAGLDRPGQKELPSKYLYDAVGSCLFETISVMPEYGLTRADERVLRRHAGDIAQLVPSPVLVSELGSGSGKKTRFILEALSQREAFSYYPIEISATALASCERELADVARVTILGVEHEYLDGLSEVAKHRNHGEHLLVLFLGSTIGNFDSGADRRFLQCVRDILIPGDCLLLGADLVKPLSQLITAYDDPAGVTAAFNLNILARINRELDADFNLRQFEHFARFNEATSSVEMHLRSRKRQTVTFPRAEFMVQFSEGESIWTESSHKYSAAELHTLADASGFTCQQQWIDQEWQFAENLFVASAKDQR